VTFHQWTKPEQLYYFTSSLKDPATQVLWDYGEDTTKSLKKLTKVLKRRFGGKNRVDKYKMDLKARRRKNNESLEELHADIRRLAVLTFPKMGQEDREGIACDSFVDALADPDLILQVRQHNPKTLDEALRAAQRLEIWARNTDHLRHEDKKSKDE